MHHASTAAWSWWSAALMAGVMAGCMAPLLAGPWATVAVRNLPGHRRRSLVCFAAGYLVFWLLVSSVLLVALHATRLHGSLLAFAVTCAVALSWQVSHRRLRWSSRCDYVRTAGLRGWRSATGHWWSGWLFAVACGRTCWAAMLAMAAAPTLLVMLLVAGLVLWEFRPGPNPFAAARRVAPAQWYAALALLTVAVSVIQTASGRAVMTGCPVAP